MPVCACEVSGRSIPLHTCPQTNIPAPAGIETETFRPMQLLPSHFFTQHAIVSRLLESGTQSLTTTTSKIRIVRCLMNEHQGKPSAAPPGFRDRVVMFFSRRAPCPAVSTTQGHTSGTSPPSLLNEFCRTLLWAICFSGRHPFC